MPEVLIEKLGKAHVLAANYRGGYSKRFFGAEEFAKALGNTIKRLEAGDKTALDDVFLWFLPISDWDDLVGKEGSELANEIIDILETYRRISDKIK